MHSISFASCFMWCLGCGVATATNDQFNDNDRARSNTIIDYEEEIIPGGGPNRQHRQSRYDDFYADVEFSEYCRRYQQR
jgi:hypothetical protein